MLHNCNFFLVAIKQLEEKYTFTRAKRHTCIQWSPSTPLSFLSRSTVRALEDMRLAGEKCLINLSLNCNSTTPDWHPVFRAQDKSAPTIERRQETSLYQMCK